MLLQPVQILQELAFVSQDVLPLLELGLYLEDVLIPPVHVSWLHILYMHVFGFRVLFYQLLGDFSFLLLLVAEQLLYGLLVQELGIAGIEVLVDVFVVVKHKVPGPLNFFRMVALVVVYLFHWLLVGCLYHVGFLF